MRICVVGTGYVGLVTGACLADFGMEVTCVDNDEAKIGMLDAGEIPIYEPGLSTLVNRNVEAERLHFTTELSDAVRRAQAVFIAVGTPPKEDGSADLSYVIQVAEAIADTMEGYTVVVTKSTVPIGTGRVIEGILRERTAGRHPFSVVSNPEFLREGSAIEDFMQPDRVVIGARDEKAVEIMRDIYHPLDTMEVPFVVTNVETSELIKYASNAFLATKITFINEVAGLCERLGADVLQVAKGMGLDDRIGPQFLHPGPGYGGSCFPKDTQALCDIAAEAGLRFEVVEAVVRANEALKRRALDKVIDALGGEVRGKSVAVLGLSFKPGTDDMRDSPSLPIVRSLVEGGATVKTYDPAAMGRARGLLPEEVVYCDDAYDAAEGASALVIVTEWNEFRSLDLDRIGSMLAERVVVDLRNVWDPAKLVERGFVYHGVGRPVEALAPIAS